MKRSVVLRTLACAAVLAVVAISATPASAALIYKNDFDAAAQVGSGISASMSGPSTFRTATAGTWNAAGWSGNVYFNDTPGNPATSTKFSFSGLASHTTVSLAGVLGFLDSWDSTNGSPSPDFLKVYIDNILVASLTSNNASGSVEFFGGAGLVAHYNQVDNNPFYSDTLIDLATASFANFAHTGSTLSIGFQASGGGWQGFGDESWGLDSFSVTYNAGVAAVPEPTSLVFYAMGSIGMCLATWRRRRAAVA